MLVVCCGMPRSASTLQYQIAVAVVRAAGIGDAAGWDWSSVSRADADPQTLLRVVKVHEPNPTLEATFDPDGVVYLLTYRDTRDAAASFLTKFGDRTPEHLELEVRRWVENHRRFAARPRSLVSRYETLVEDISAEVRRIAGALGVAVDDDVTRSIASELSPERQRRRVDAFERASAETWDASTLLHRGHLVDGAIGKWKTDLGSRHLDAVLRASGDWLGEMGYTSVGEPSSRGAA